MKKINYEWIERKWNRFIPPGMDLQQELKWALWGLALAAAVSVLSFAIPYIRAYSELYDYIAASTDPSVELGWVLKQGARMPDLVNFIGGTRDAFLYLSLFLLALTGYHYLYYYQGSKSIYVMRRLPDRWEIHRRSVTLPLLMIGICIVVSFLLTMFYYGIYMLATPEECMAAGQWMKLWSRTGG